MDYKDKSNSELYQELMSLKLSHDNLKDKIINDLDKLTVIEDEFNKVDKILKKRLNVKA